MVPKLSDLTPIFAAHHVRADRGDEMLGLYLDAARAYVLSYTGLTAEAADAYSELAVAALILTSDMYDNRQATVDSDKVNRVLNYFLGAHDHNLLPGQGVVG